ncbi:interferon-induced protein 44-like [Aplochiton taeniatus]
MRRGKNQGVGRRKRGALREEVVSYEPVLPSLKRVRVLLLGPKGAGKSSFINSVRSVLNGRVILLPFIGAATKDVMKKLKSFNVRSEKGGKATALTMVDVQALGDVDIPGLTLSDALAVIKGHAPDGSKVQFFEPDKPLNAGSAGYRAEPSIEDKIHCVVFVLNACHVMSSSDSLQKTLRRLQVEISELDIPQVVLLTNVDQVCHGLQKDVKYVYTSHIVQEKIQKCAEMVGLPVSYVFPVKNYSSELSVNCNTDILLLTAVSHILQSVDDTLEENGFA